MNVANAAERLFSARVNARPIDELPTRERPSDIDESYESVSYTHLTLPTTPYV